MIAISVLIFECLIMAFLKGNGATERPVQYILIAIAVFSFAYIADLARSRRLKPVSVPLVLGYLMRVALLIFDLYGRHIYALPGSGADTEMFYLTSVQYALYGDAGRGGLTSQIMGTVFRWIGVSRLYGQFLLMLCSIVALHLAARIMEETGVDRRVRVKAMYILCLLPNFAILSAIFLRESLVVVFVALSLLCFARWFMGRAEPYFWLSFVFVFCSAAFHSGTVGVAAGYILVKLLYDREKRSFRLNWKSILTALIFLLGFVFLYNNYGDRFFAKMMNIESIEDIASGGGRGGSSYAAYVGNSLTPWNMVRYTPARIVYFLFSPFPWQWRGLRDIIAFVFNSLFYIWSIIAAVRYVMKYRTERSNVVTALLIVALCTLFVFAWGTNNTGTAVRHRDKMVVLYAVMLAVTLSGRRSRRTYFR